jgi:tRNA 2-thiocytidine biosynthesis protein TtcA
LNLFYGGRLKAMSPKLVSDDGRHVVIRPLAYMKEADLAHYAQLRGFPIIPCDLCGSQEHLQRRQMREMLNEWERRYPGRAQTIFNALARVVPSHLMDSALFDFRGLRPTGAPDPAGDLAFDDAGCEAPSDGVIRLERDEDD